MCKKYFLCVILLLPSLRRKDDDNDAKSETSKEKFLHYDVSP